MTSEIVNLNTFMLKIIVVLISLMRRIFGFNNRFRTTKNTEAIVFENSGFVGSLGLSKKLWKKIY